MISPGAPSHGATESEKKDVQFLARMKAWKGLKGGVNRHSKGILPSPSPRFLGVLGRKPDLRRGVGRGILGPFPAVEMTRTRSATQEMVPGQQGWEGLGCPSSEQATDQGPTWGEGRIAGWQESCWPLHRAPGPKSHAVQSVGAGLGAEWKGREQPSLVYLTRMDSQPVPLGA